MFVSDVVFVLVDLRNVPVLAIVPAEPASLKPPSPVISNRPLFVMLPPFGMLIEPVPPNVVVPVGATLNER